MEEDNVAALLRLRGLEDDPVEARLVFRCQKVSDGLRRQIVERFIIGHDWPCDPQTKGLQESSALKSVLQGWVEDAPPVMHVLQRGKVQQAQRTDDDEPGDGGLAAHGRTHLGYCHARIRRAVEYRDAARVHPAGTGEPCRRRAEMEVWATQRFFELLVRLEHARAVEMIERELRSCIDDEWATVPRLELVDVTEYRGKMRCGGAAEEAGFFLQ